MEVLNVVKLQICLYAFAMRLLENHQIQQQALVQRQQMELMSGTPEPSLLNVFHALLELVAFSSLSIFIEMCNTVCRYHTQALFLGVTGVECGLPPAKAIQAFSPHGCA